MQPDSIKQTAKAASQFVIRIEFSFVDCIYTQSLGGRNFSYNSASGVPASGCQS